MKKQVNFINVFNVEQVYIAPIYSPYHNLRSVSISPSKSSRSPYAIKCRPKAIKPIYDNTYSTLYGSLPNIPFALPEIRKVSYNSSDKKLCIGNAMKCLIERFKDREVSVEQFRKTKVNDNLNQLFFREEKIHLQTKKRAAKASINAQLTYNNKSKIDFNKTRKYRRASPLNIPSKIITYHKSIDSSDKLCAWEPFNGPTTPYDEMNSFKR